MALMHTPICDFGWPAPDFELVGIDGKTYAFADIAGKNGTLIAFISNHCPYVQAIEKRLARDARQLQDLGIGVAAICSNDVINYPEDGIDGMRDQAKRAGFDFAYLHDESQSVARAYNAICTPDFFGFNNKGQLQYRGRLDESGMKPAHLDARRELYEAMQEIAKTGQGPKQQTPSMGCSIKWK